MIPEHISVRIESELNKKITRSEPQSGGDINQAAIVTFDDNTPVSYTHLVNPNKPDKNEKK